MDEEKRQQFLEEYMKMNDAMARPGMFDRNEVVLHLSNLCKLLRVCKGVTEFYINPSMEKAGRGERLCDVDYNGPCRIIHKIRIVTKSMAVVIGTLYAKEEEPEHSPEEMYKMDLVLRSILSFVSMNRLLGAIEQMAFNDDAGYPNIRSFTRRLERLNIEGTLHQFNTALLNLRHFSLVNEDIGRQAGDIVMRNYCRMIEAVVGEGGILCRMGGDNFLAIFRKENTDRFLEIMRGIPIAYDPNSQRRIMVNAGTGVFVIPKGFEYVNQGSVMDKLIPASRAARMQDNEDLIVFYDEKVTKAFDKTKRVQMQFPIALENNEFHVFYQPKVNVYTGKIVGAEALCRWVKGDRIIPPIEFIPILEATTEICLLDFYMLDKVCKDIKRWIDEGREVVKVSVNLSRKHLIDVDLFEHILSIIDQNGTPHEYIEIELTETTTDVEFRDLKRVVAGLQHEGISTSVDDFGMGYSSLNLIREIPWNVLKIDKCFLPVDVENTESVTSMMYKHVLSMAKDIGLECITEGVETREQLELLRENDCNIAQGFLFDKPLPVEEFEKKLGTSYVID
ncbi:MAG: GGDEF domain-containing protein [Lachnospiraceae bacterium]|nr:GGDEF domain-containing protein [Lachnospiraceae bacterium]